MAFSDNNEKNQIHEESAEQAFAEYQKAAEAGDTDAMCNLVDCYRLGIGCEQSFEKAEYWRDMFSRSLA